MIFRLDVVHNSPSKMPQKELDEKVIQTAHNGALTIAKLIKCQDHQHTFTKPMEN
jgi:hypothetical protein